MSVETLNTLFVIRCEIGQLNAVKYMLTCKNQDGTKKYDDRTVKQGFVAACHRRHPRVLHAIYNHLGTSKLEPEIKCSFQQACIDGKLPMVKTLYNMADKMLKQSLFTVYIDQRSAMKLACRFCHINILDWMNTIKPNCVVNKIWGDVGFIKETFILDKIEMLNWLTSKMWNHDSATKFDIQRQLKAISFVELCTHGAVNIMRMLVGNGWIDMPSADFDIYASLKTASEHGRLKIVKFLYEKLRLEIHDLLEETQMKDCWEIAVRNNHEDVATFLVENDERLRNIANSLYDIPMSFPMIVIQPPESCAICYDAKSDLITDCKHQFCKDCLTNWWKRGNKISVSCPCCRAPVTSVHKQWFGFADMCSK